MYVRENPLWKVFRGLKRKVEDVELTMEEVIVAKGTAPRLKSNTRTQLVHHQNTQQP